MASDDLSVSSSSADDLHHLSSSSGGRKVKLLCSSGGRILPRPSDNALRYVGGETRIVTVRRDTALPGILRKMAEAHGGGVVVLRYQLPDEDLDALISVSTQEDLENMMDEYDKLVARDPAAKLRVFLFPPSEAGLGGGADHYFASADLQDVSAKYLEAVNGVERKDSVASFSSNGTAGTAAAAEVGEDGNEGTAHSVVSSNNASVHEQSTRSFVPVSNVVELPPFHSYSDQNEMLSVSQSDLPPVATYLPQVFVDQHSGQYINPSPFVMMGVPPLVNMVGMAPQTSAAGVQVDPSQMMKVSNGVPPPQMTMESNLEGNNNGVKMPRPPSDPKFQPLSQLPPMPPPHLLAPSRQGPQILKSQGMISPPHAYSDPKFSEHSSGSRSIISESKPVSQNHHADNITRMVAPQSMASGAVVDGELDNLMPTPSLESYGFRDTTPEFLAGNERQVFLNVDSLSPGNAAANVENHEQAKILSQPASILVPSKHLISTSVPNQEESAYNHVLFPNNIGLSKNPVKQDAVVDNIASNVIFGESLAAQHCQLIHENFPGPANTNVFSRPMVPMSDTLFISPSQASVSNQQSPAVVSSENGMTVESKLKTSPLAVENNHDLKAQGQSTLMPIYTSMVPPDAVLEQNASPLADPLLPTPVNYIYIQNIHPPNGTYTSNVAGSNAYVYNHEAGAGTTGFPSYVYDNTTLGTNGIGYTKNMDPNFQLKEAFFNPSIPASGNTEINVTRNAAQQENWQESTSTNSLFSNEDPQKILGNASEVSTKSKKEFVFTKDMHPEFIRTDGKDSDVVMLPERNLSSKSSDLVDKELLVETVWPLQEQESVEPDTMVSAEYKKAPALSLSKPPRTVLNSQESKESSSVNGENGNNDKTDDGKSENTKAKQLDKANYGFPNVDDIEHLQVIHNDDLEELQELGSGTFGIVYHGKWRGTDVAIKRLNDRVFSGKQSEQERARMDFWNEAKKLASLHHPNVVAFYGIVSDGPGGTVATVTEYMVNGSLRTALQKNDRILDRRRRLIIAMDVAFGMEYLHSKDIIHFDLKSDNLLVNLRDPQRPICKVGDLGLSKLKYETLMSGGMRGTLPWMAPEILGGKKHTEKVDVFSFGIVMWELLTGEEPYADLHYGAIIGGIINNTLRPPVPESCDPEWKSLMEQCWSNDPLERPSFTEIAGRLRQIAASLPQKK